MAQMFLISLNKHIIAYLWVFLLAYSVEVLYSAEESLGSYYDPIREIISKKDLGALVDIKEKIEERKPGPMSIIKGSELSDFCSKTHLDASELEFLMASVKEGGKLRQLIGFLFYPYTELQGSIKTNFNQLPLALRVSLLISAEFDFKPARDLLSASHLGKIKDTAISSAEEIDSFLQTPFALEDLGILNACKGFISIGDNFFQFVERVRASHNRHYILNAGYLFRALGRLDLSEAAFRHAADIGSKRAAIELGFLLLRQDFEGNKGYFLSDHLAPLGLHAYGVWKIAQCLRYGKGTTRNLQKANELYLHATSISASDPSQSFSEIHYDAGDFAVYCALGQPDPGQKVHALNRAMVHFEQAINLGMGAAYEKQAEVAEKLMNMGALSQEILLPIIHHAAESGFFEIAERLAKKHSITLPTTFKAAKAEEYNLYYQKVSKKAKEW